MNWQLAFAAYAAQHPEVGKPIREIEYDADGNAYQLGVLGVLVYWTATGKIVWVRYDTAGVIEQQAAAITAAITARDTTAAQNAALIKQIAELQSKISIARGALIG